MKHAKSKIRQHRDLLIVGLKNEGYSFEELAIIFNISESYAEKIYWKIKK